MKARKIELKTIPMVGMTGTDGGQVNVVYAQNLDALVRTQPERGHTTDDLLIGSDIRRLIREGGDIILLSEEEFKWLLNKLNTQRGWGDVNEALAEFIKDIRAAPLVDVEEKSASEEKPAS